MGSPKPSFRFMPFHFLPSLLFFFSFSSVLCLSAPLNCSDTSRVCIAFLAYRAAANQSLALIVSKFDVLPSDVTMELIPEADGSRYLFIRKNCFFFPQEKQYLSSISFTVTKNNGYLEEIRAYDGLLADKPNLNRKTYIGEVVSLRLLCGCSTSVWNYMITYVVREGDTVASLSSRFGVSMGDIAKLIGLNASTVGKVYYIPSMSVPGVPYFLDEFYFLFLQCHRHLHQLLCHP